MSHNSHCTMNFCGRTEILAAMENILKQADTTGCLSCFTSTQSSHD
jgi:hypothetical protein